MLVIYLTNSDLIYLCLYLSICTYVCVCQQNQTKHKPILNKIMFSVLNYLSYHVKLAVEMLPSTMSMLQQLTVVPPL